MAGNTAVLGLRRPPHARGDKYGNVQNLNWDKMEYALRKRTKLVEVPVANASVNSVIFCEDEAVIVTAIDIISDTATTGSDGSNSWDIAAVDITATDNVAALLTDTTEIAADVVNPMVNDDLAGRTLAADAIVELQWTKVGTPTDLTAAKVYARVTYYVASTS